MWPVLLFAIAMSAVAGLARQAHFFHASAHYVRRLARGSDLALFLIFCGLVILCTVFLSIDTAAVMLTPAAVALAMTEGKSTRPLTYAVIWLANTASLLLPVSNLTNLLALQRGDGAGALATGTLGFAGLTWIPWLVCAAMPILAILVLEWREISSPGRTREPLSADRIPEPNPVLMPSEREERAEIRDRGLLIRASIIIALLCLALALGVTPWIAGTLAAVALALSTLATPGVKLPSGLIPVKMMTLVIGLFFATDVCASLARSAFGALELTNPALIAGAGVIGANAVNNLPAYLALEPAVSGAQGLLALLIGVNAGPIITPWASLATLLWYEQLVAEGQGVNWWRFIRRGAILAPLTVGAAVAISLSM